MGSTVGRPRKLTDAQVAEILEWHRSRKTLWQVAREYGVSPTTIQNVIDANGHYKQPSPECRAENQARSQQLRRRLRLQHFL